MRANTKALVEIRRNDKAVLNEAVKAALGAYNQMV
jgi:hypothetical protein